MGPGLGIDSVERATPGDLITLAMDLGPLPSHVGAILRFGGIRGGSAPTCSRTRARSPSPSWPTPTPVPDLPDLATAVHTELSTLCRPAAAVGQRASISPSGGRPGRG